MLRISEDEKIFNSYGRLINPAYPAFLSKMGIKNIAVKAEGATITDSSGKGYIDCVAGYGLFNIGHNNPEIIKAIQELLNTNQLLTKPFITEIQAEMAECIEELAPGDLSCSFILNSGSEAIDCALKLARLHKGRKGQIISARNSFHGHTFGALSASGISSFKRSFEPLLTGFESVPYGDIESLERAMQRETAAVLIEPVQHEAGVVLPPENYLLNVRKLCDQNNVIFILDEIKTGIGKTGKMFACEHYDIIPDILVLGKSLGGGLIPIGAIVARKNLWTRFGLSFAMSASSYAGNSLACCAGISTIRYIRNNNLLDEARKKSQLLLGAFREQASNFPNIIRAADGLGLLIGISTRNSRIALKLVQQMIQSGVLVMPAFGDASVIMVEPPLVISNEQIDVVIDGFGAACKKVSQDN